MPAATSINKGADRSGNVSPRRLAAPDFSHQIQRLKPKNPCLTLRCGAFMVRRDFEGCERSFRACFRAS